MPNRTLCIKEIGEVEFCRNKRAKYLRITIKSQGKIRVTIPARYSYREAEEFVIQKLDSIKSHLEKINKGKQIYSENSEFSTRNFRLEIQKHSINRCAYILKEGVLRFYYPEDADISNPQIQGYIKNSVIEALRYEAKLYLPQRVEQLAGKYGFNYKKVYVKNLKSRWGSCSSVNNINLNLHLMRLPDYLTDYVILHELAHTREKNHGKNFYNLLNKFVRDSKKLDKELKSYPIEL